MWLPRGSGAAEEDPILLPSKSEQADDDDGGDEDMGDGDEDDVMVYTVQRGDTLRRVAAQLGISYQVLAAQTDTPSLIFAGQRFVYSARDLGDAESGTVPAANRAPVEESTGQIWEFTVRQGDTLSHIAMWLGVSVDELAEQVDNPRFIVPGQKIAYVHGERIDTPPRVTDNDGTDSDGYDTTGNYTDNDGADSDGYDTTGQQSDNDSGDSGLSS